MRSECSSPTYSSRAASLRPRICFSVINSASPCGERRHPLLNSGLHFGIVDEGGTVGHFHDLVGKPRCHRRGELVGVLSENAIRPDSRGELESAHHPVRCLRSSACLGCSWPTSSSRERGLRPRSFSCVINSTSA